MIRKKASCADLQMVTLIAAALSLALAGCTPAAAPDRPSPVDSIDQSAAEIGSMRLDLSPPVKLDNAKLTFVRFGDGRPSVVQIANYDISSEEHGFPAVLFHGTTKVTRSELLAGQTIDCFMFYQESKSSMIATTKPGESVRLTFRSLGVTGTAVSIALEPVELISADNRIIPVAGGQITAITYDWTP